MATSIYATPPPDLSGEDTALSDVSNSSSSLNNQNSSVSGSGSGMTVNTATTATASNNTNTNTSNSFTASTATANSNNNNNNNNNNNSTHTTDDAIVATTTTTATTAAIATNLASATTIAGKKVKRTITDLLTDESNSSGDQGNGKKQIIEQLDMTTVEVGSSTNASSGCVGVDGGIEAALSESIDESPSLAALPSAQNATAAMAAMAVAANAAMQLQFLEAINDAAKKRRKQNNPSRLEALNLTGDLSSVVSAAQANEPLLDAAAAAAEFERKTRAALPIDYEDKLSKMLLPKSMEQLKETFEMLQQQQLQQQQKLGNISPKNATTAASRLTIDAASEPTARGMGDSKSLAETSPTAVDQQNQLQSPYRTFCKECGENFESDLKLGLHMLQEHNSGSCGGSDISQNHNIGSTETNQQASARLPFGIYPPVKVKMERNDDGSMSSPPLQSTDSDCQHESSGQGLSNGSKEQWLNSLSGITFPFPPEAAAAAALSAGGYLPLLGVPNFPGIDGLNRPPLRIFNPEAYCDLCNKEFCNKYFLKTHKANKHGIYDPAGSGSIETSATANANVSSTAMGQIFQLQMQQQHQQQQQQQQLQQQLHLQQQQQQQNQQQQQQKQPFEPRTQPQNSAVNELAAGQRPAALSIPQQVPPSAPQPVFCDICSKRFTNVFAMRRHRSKVHEQPPNAQRSSPNEQQSVKRESNPPSQPSPKPQDKMATSAASNPESNASPAAAQVFNMPDGFCQDFSLEQEEVAFTPQPRKLSPQLQQQAREANFSHEKLKRLGVLNPESFCELCCKEYCNKYFLRTHKWKRHGIFVPPDDVKDEQTSAALTSKLPWPFMNMAAGMPLNLMINEKAMANQRVFQPAAQLLNTGEETATSAQPVKRIKLEINDDEEQRSGVAESAAEHATSHDEQQTSSQQQQQLSSVPSTPEPSVQQKMQPDISGNLTESAAPSPDAVMGLQNLQKLQSMILQLNDLNGKRPMNCHLCSREVENQYALHMHIMTDHMGGGGSSALNPDLGSSMPLSFQQHILQQQQQAIKMSPTGSPTSSQANNELRCNPCEREFSSLIEFKQHIAEVHLLSSPLRDGFITPERPINPTSGMTRPPYTITPTSSYCEICNKELCNKYFMKTHMQRMHGIEIENGAQIGGVVCNICNKELCSKYFLRVHKHNTHGIIEEGSPLPQPRQNGLSFEQQQQQQQLMESDLARGLNLSPFGAGVNLPSGQVAAELKMDSMESTRFNANWTEVCPICSRRFRNTKWLRAHLLSDHGPAGIEKLREMEQQFGAASAVLSKPNSPTLKIPNGAANSNLAQPQQLVPNSANLAQALQNLNTQHLLANMPKNAVLPSMFGAIAEQALQPPRLKEYQCSVCPFTTPYYAFLFIHERTHTMPNNADGENDEPSMTEIAEKQQEQLLSSPTPSPNLNADDEMKGTSAQLPAVGTSNSNNNSNSSCVNSNTVTTSFSIGSIASKSPNKIIAAAATLEAAPDSTEMHKNDGGDATAAAMESVSSSSIDATCDVKQNSATSPLASPSKDTSILDMLSTVANKHLKAACFAVPKDITNGSDSESSDAQRQQQQQMQAFILKAAQNASTDNSNSITSKGSAAASPAVASNRFVPAIVFLPVRERISDEVTVTFTLRPT